VERIVGDIEEKRPSFILNNLIGPSSYAFLAAMHALGQRDPAFLPENCPIASCDLTECELGNIEAGAATGQLCALPYVDSLDTQENRAFKARLSAWRPEPRRVSSMFASAYAAVTLCIDAIEAGNSDEPAAVRREILARSWPSVLGNIVIDPATNHAALPFHLGRINDGPGFDVIVSRPASAADPYLTGAGQKPAPWLRVVS
jgi:branched-chain amino acid transport system substrate-binding protein